MIPFSKRQNYSHGEQISGYQESTMGAEHDYQDVTGGGVFA